MLANTRAYIEVADSYKPNLLACILRQPAPVYALGQVVDINSLERHRHVGLYHLVHHLLYGLLLLPCRLVVEYIANLALLPLHMSIGRTLATEEPNHYLIEKMLGSMRWRELILVVLVEHIISIVLHYGEFKYSSAVWSQVGRELSVALQLNCLLLARQQVSSHHTGLSQAEIVEGMVGYGYLDVHPVAREIGNYKYDIVTGLAQESEVATWIELIGSRIDIHKVEEVTIIDGFLTIGYAQYLLIFQCQSLLLLRHVATVKVAVDERVERPVVEDGRTSVTSREALSVHTLLAKLLSGIEHERIAHEQSRDYNTRNSLVGIATEEV